MAASRSLQATPDGINKIQNALTTKQWSQEDLAKKALVANSTAKNFCAGKAVDRKNFARFCQMLELDWEIISGKVAEGKPNPSPITAIDIDTLVQALRDCGRADIQKRCGTMRVLAMTQPIDANAIYTDVNILEKVAGKTRAEIHQLMQGCSPENFDRFFLGDIRHERVDGLKAIKRYNLLMILGRPGAGKSTFLKRLAMLCSLQKQFIDRVPVFVTLKEFADTINQPGLVNSIAANFAPQFGLEACRRLLESGRGLVLLDGLDEVQEKDRDRVIREIRAFSQRYSQNTIIITCRIAAGEYIFEQFTEVQIADFNQEQIEVFVTKWFRLKNPYQAKSFLERLDASKPVKELASNPLLLTLLCLEFEEASDFPASRAELYQRGLNVLLTKWDGQRGIKRDAVYQKLSTKRKESLLGELAFYTFEQGDYFFKQVVAERQISQYIQDLPDASTDPEVLLVDSHAVLKSIENQHGLLTERATEIYSFSHLTFHEYFVAKHLTDRPEREATINQLLGHSAEPRWKEIFLLVTEQLEPADALLQGLKAKADEGLNDDPKLQSYLTWVQEKSSSVFSELELGEVRRFYFDLARVPTRFLGTDRSRPRVLDIDLDLFRVLALALTSTLDLALSLGVALALALASAPDPEFKQQLQQLYNALPDTSAENLPNLQEWWKSNGEEWTNNLRQLAIKYRNIGHDWQFTEEQSQKLWQYYEVNQLLIDCLNSECRISRSVREEIEETLFLPFDEVEQWKREHRPS
jgi:predicted NACHT family NTPase